MTNKMLAVQNAIKTALEAITTDASAYNFDIYLAKFGAPNVDDVVAGPEVFIQSLREEGVQRPTNTVRKRLHYTVIGITGSDVRYGDIGTETLKLGADIEKAITTDITLGSVVDYSQLDEITVQYFSEAGKGMISLDFYSEYPVTVGSP